MGRQVLFAGALEDKTDIGLPVELVPLKDDMTVLLNLICEGEIVDPQKMGCKVSLKGNTITVTTSTKSPLPSDHAAKVVVEWGEDDNATESELEGSESDTAEE